MGSNEWEDLLQKKLAFLPGSCDTVGGPILVVPLTSDLGNHDLGGISATLKYLKTIPSSSSQDRGWVVLVDARSCPYRLVKPTVSTIRAALGNIRFLFVVRPEGFWEKQIVDCRRSEVDSQPIHISCSKLLRYMEASQLPVCFGGTLSYDHISWIKSRKMFEEFVDEAERTKRDLESLQSELRREAPCSRASSLQNLLTANSSSYNSVTSKPQYIFKKGENVLSILEMDEESGFKISETLGFTDETSRRVKNLLQELDLLHTSVQSSWRRLQSALNAYHEVQQCEHEMSDIGKWLVSADQMLLREPRIGLSLKEAESLLRENEAVELKCRETYARWARLRYRVEEALERGEGELRAMAEHDNKTVNLRALKEYTDTLVRSFASRLDRRRTLILASTRFHRMVVQMEQRSNVLLKDRRWSDCPSDLDGLKKNIRELTARKEALDYLGSESKRAGEKLLDLLAVGVKDLSGRDVTPDYSKELNHVHSLMRKCHDYYDKASKNGELTRLRLQQACQLMTCHRDLKQAQEWLVALLETLVVSQSHVGRSVDEIRVLKNDHQKFQNTASGTFEYGYECARAALLVEKSGGSPTPSESRRLINKLEETWKTFLHGSQEQLTRLRVAAVFFRTMEQHLSRLETLISITRLRDKSKLAKHPLDTDGKRILTARERLLREIGRNVRLGKLLKERLNEPLVSYFKNENFNENQSAQDAISDQINFITVKARLLDSLMIPSEISTHQRGNSTSPPTTITAAPSNQSPLPPTPPSTSPLLSKSESPFPPPPETSLPFPAFNKDSSGDISGESDILAPFDSFKNSFPDDFEVSSAF